MKSYFEPGKICTCGNCEDAASRALGYVAKAITDGECTIFTGAVGILISAISSKVMGKQIEGIMEDKGVPSILAPIMADQQMMETMNSLAATVKAWFDKHGDTKITPVLDEAIERANKAYEEEQNLPKGD